MAAKDIFMDKERLRIFPEKYSYSYQNKLNILVKETVQLNDVDTVNCGHIGAGDRLPEQKPTSDSPPLESQTLWAPTLENKDKMIIGAAVMSSLLFLILVYFIVIRPYLKRRTEISTGEPMDTSRAPMDLTFRPPPRKHKCLKACFFCKP